jgi:hypothetical protein
LSRSRRQIRSGACAPPSTKRRDGAVLRRRLAALIIATVAGLQIYLVSVVLNPRTFFSGDPGVKYLQAYSLIANRWSSFEIPNPGPRVDPQGEFSVLSTNQFTRRAGEARFYGDYSVLFTVPVSLFLALFGARGVYVIPILSAVGTMILTYRLALRVAPRAAWLAPALVGACSPMLFYSVELAEHSLATLLVMAAVLLFATAVTVSALWRFALAGLALGVAIGVREELCALLPAALVALAWVEPRRRVPAGVAAFTGLLSALAPHLAFKWWLVGVPMRRDAMRALGLAARPVEAQGVWEHLAGFAYLLPLSAAWLLPLAAALAARWWIIRARRQAAIVLFVAAVAALWGMADAAHLISTWELPQDMLRAFPAALFLLLLPSADGAADPARRELRMILAIAAVFVVIICAAVPFAFRIAGVVYPEWGPRYLMPVFPLLAVGIVFALERRDAWRVTAPRGLVAGVFVVLAFASLAVQAQGVRQLRNAKHQYEMVLGALEAVDSGDLVVTDLWWFAAVNAAVLYQHQVVAVDTVRTGSLPALLARLNERHVSALTFVTGTAYLSDAHARALAAAGWSLSSRRVVPIWLEIGFLSYRRDGPTPQPRGAAPIDGSLPTREGP